MYRKLVLFVVMGSLIAVGQGRGTTGGTTGGTGTGTVTTTGTTPGNVTGTGTTLGATGTGNVTTTGVTPGNVTGTGNLPGATGTGNVTTTGVTPGNVTGIGTTFGATGTGNVTTTGVTPGNVTGTGAVIGAVGPTVTSTGPTIGTGIITGTTGAVGTPGSTVIGGQLNGTTGLLTSGMGTAQAQIGVIGTTVGTPAGTNTGGLNINSGFVTTAAPSAAQLPTPLLSPPNAALPGSGPATGAPPQIGINDTRTGGAGNVFQPGVGTLTIGGAGAITTQATPVSVTGNQVVGILNTGMGKFVSSAPTQVAQAQQPNQMTLADVAREFKARRASAHPRTFDNTHINAINTRTGTGGTAQALPASDQPAATAGGESTPTAVLDQRDLAAVESALAASRAAGASTNPNVADPNVAVAEQQVQQRMMTTPSGGLGGTVEQGSNAQTEQPSAQQTVTIAQASQPSGATTPATTQPTTQAGTKTQATQKQQLPASSSPLPLLALAGLLVAAVGVAFAFRARRNNY